MTEKVSARAPANIAFIKYWGTRDVDRTLPFNPSISMTLRECVSHTTLESVPDLQSDEVWLAAEGGDLEPAAEVFARGVTDHLDRLRVAAGRDLPLRVATRNSFPSAAGMASSASGFAALTLAAARLLGLDESPAELSVLARLSGSGSAARSVLGGYVEWPAPRGGDHAMGLAPAAHWDLRDVIAVVDRRAKSVSSRQGHALAVTSPYFERRLEVLPARLGEVRRAIERRSFFELASVLEEEAVDLHLIAMSSRPPIFYWQPATLEVLAAARRMRGEGVGVGATMDAGANVHLICLPEAEAVVVETLEGLPGVQEILRDRVGDGPEITDRHLL